MSDDTHLGGPGRDFPRTTAGFLDTLGFETLCRRYWKPVYAFVRVSGATSNEDAKDLTQAFFLWLFEGELLARYERERASFRNYLKGILRRFLADQRKAAGRIKRGGDATLIPMDEVGDVAGEPDAVFDQSWMSVLMKGAIDAVKARYAADGRAEQIRVFEAHDLEGAGSYADVAARLGLSESRVRDTLAAVRRAIRAEIHAELARQTSGPDELEEEWNALRGA